MATQNKNLQRILPNLLEWTKEANKDYSNTITMYSEIAGQFNRYMGHVTRNIAGIYTTPKYVEQQGAIYEYVPTKTQKEAMQFLDKQLFTTPTWLANKDLIEKCGIDPVNIIGIIQRNVLNQLLSRYTLDKMLKNETLNGTSAYTAFQMLDDLKKSIWSELASGKVIDIYRRNLQKNYVDACISISGTAAVIGSGITITVRSNSSSSDATAIGRAHLVALRADIAKVLPTSTGISKAHLQELVAKIDEALNPKN